MSLNEQQVHAVNVMYADRPGRYFSIPTLAWALAEGDAERLSHIRFVELARDMKVLVGMGIVDHSRNVPGNRGKRTVGYRLNAGVRKAMDDRLSKRSKGVSHV